jgi:hypothetical protein
MISRLVGMICVLMVGASLVWGMEEYTLVSDFGTSAEMISVGRVGGFSKTADVIFENPAGLRSIKWMGFSFFSSQVIDAAYQGLSFAMKVGEGVVGVGMVGSSISDLVQTGDYSERQGPGSNFSVSESVVRMGYQSNISPAMSAGVAAVVMSKDFFSDSVSAWNLEVGVSQVLKPFSYSIVARNILPVAAVYRSGATEKVSLQVIPSVCIPLSPLTVYGQARWINSDQPKILSSFGVTWAIIPDHFSISAGRSELMTTAAKTTARLSVGTVLSINALRLQYAYEKSDYEDDRNQHYFSVGVGW